ncbi:MAG: DEAD/DEAH box helicase [Bacillota bacterium]|nr:DEAD/DEAH box helicase [Bacillota bacterium]
MFDIKEETVRNWAGELVFKRGLDLYNKGKVKRIELQRGKNIKSGFNMTRIMALVETSAGRNIHEVEVLFNDRTGIMQVRCDCKAFMHYYVCDQICEHVSAALIKYAREKDKIKNNKSIKTDRLIEQIKDKIINNEVRGKELDLEVKFEFQDFKSSEASIELRIGDKKLYVVKNMKEFMRTIKYQGSELEFGKNFTFVPKYHKFKKEDEPLISLILELFEADERGKDNYYQNNSVKFLNGKKAYFTDSKLRRFFEIMMRREINVVIGNNIFSNVYITDEKMPLQFSIYTKSNNIILEQLDELPVSILDEEYYFYGGKVYKADKQQINLYLPFYNTFISEHKKIISFDNEDIDKVASYIIPTINKISDNLQLVSSIEEKLHDVPVEPKIFMDKENKNVVANVIFKYGSIEINPILELKDNSKEKILLRDIHSEVSIINLLESYGFRQKDGKFILSEEEEIIDFLNEGIERLQKYSEIYYSDGFKNMKIFTPTNYSGGVRLNDEDLLELSLDIEGVDKEELKDIFNALRQKKKYYRLKKGGFVQLQSKELDNLNSLVEHLDINLGDLSKENIILPKYNALYIDEDLKIKGIDYFNRDEKFKSLIKSITEIKEADYTVPFNLENTMRNYQKVGFKWFKTLASCGFGGILADEMGLGKTLQTIAFIASEAGDKVPSLVIAPTSLVYNWKSEIEKFSPDLKAEIISGTKEERKEVIANWENYDVLITSYPLIRRDIEEYKDITFKYCILDEAQQIKNPNSINAKSVKDIKAKRYFALTGTPIENSLTELWSIFDFIMPGYLMNHHKFINMYEAPIVKNGDKEALAELNKHIRPFILRRVKNEVIKELPPKIEHKITVEMSEEQKKLYMAYLMEAKKEISEEINVNGFDRSKIKILSLLTRLRQICCEPSVFVENFKGDSGKMLALEDILENTINEGHRVLLFSQFTSVLKVIGKRLDKAGLKYMYLDGKTKMEDRGRMVNDFNHGLEKVFLISLKAGGTGLNLTGADTVIHFDPWWNPAVEEQASDRAHRIGQKKTVEVIKLITRGTIEEKIYNLQEKKKQIIDNIMKEANSGDTILTSMSQQELEELLSV